MKFAVLISGMLGFAIVAITGAQAERPSDLVLRDAALACLGMAFVGRWFWSVVEQAFVETVKTRQAAAEAAEAEAAAAEKPSPAASAAKIPSPRSVSNTPASFGADR